MVSSIELGPTEALTGARPAPRRESARGPVPDRLEEYRILAPLGRGGMGEVYLAADTILDRPVAVKFLSELDPDYASRERFLTEARAAARLQHPNVVTVFRVGEHDGRPFIVSELVRGKSLDRIEHPVPWRRVLDIALDLGRGLAAAHRRGVLHRDVKPANAILAEDGTVKLLDFGVAKLLGQDTGHVAPPPAPPRPGRRDRDTPITIPVGPPRARSSRVPPDPPPSRIASEPPFTPRGAIVGTPLYMAPEVWRGDPATRRSDIYSLGVLLYELASGMTPHRASSRDELCAAVQSGAARPLAAAAPDVHHELGAIVDRCLRVDPGARWASADELIDALEQLTPLARSGPVPPGNPYRGLRPFEPEHRPLFFGRSGEVRMIVDRLRSDPFVLVAGDSGVGKSSLCRAGVLPVLMAPPGLDGRSWSSAILVPGPRPLAALASALAPALGCDESRMTAALREPELLGRALGTGLGPDAGIAILGAVGCSDELVQAADAVLANNGRSLNGRSLNGRSLNGRSLNGPTLVGDSPGGVRIVGVWLDGSALRAALDDGTEIGGSELVGARIEGTLEDGSAVSLVVTDVSLREPDVLVHSISFETADDAGWVCAETGDGHPIGAVPLAGAWDYGEGTPTGGSRTGDADAITFACEQGALFKCVELGYRPWSSVVERLGRWTHEIALAELHQACTRALRADYCGDGRSHTLTEVEIDLWDAVGVQDREPSRPGRWEVEAEWTVGGASCIRRERIAESGAREYVADRCPDRWVDDEESDSCGSRRSNMYAPTGFDVEIETRTLLMNEVRRLPLSSSGVTTSTRTIEESSSSVRLKIRQARLRVLGGPDTGASVVLDRPCTTVGSDPACELPLADDTVSRRHLSIERSGLEHVLVDLGSRNGTFVGGARVERAVLGDGAEIVLGRTRLRLEAFEEEVGVEPLATDRLGNLRGTSPAMRQLYGLVERVAATDLPVLIAGETGTGKELVAREIHARSSRAAEPFEVLDCGALPETLADSALFGHERGAFTGAHERFVGVFERAGGGTLLLDELGELPSALQPKLLGVLERGRFRRLAGDEDVPSRARVLCATHRDLEEAVGRGAFRRDLLFRVDVLRIEVPPLRGRGEDLITLARYLGGDRPMTAACIDAIRRHGWPGNVRELRNAMRFASALAKRDAIDRADLPPTVLGEAPALSATFHDAKSDAIERFERRYLAELLAASGGNVTRAAEAADIDRRHLHRLLAKYGISS